MEKGGHKRRRLTPEEKLEIFLEVQTLSDNNNGTLTTL
jgi:hypothetical protein